ncbi:MAG TPA: hypothetical protein VHG28_12470, partial [Longimicrobiaceae bacterium]|nr:hypothetical protein [Longimicrobiaceae bacterium]
MLSLAALLGGCDGENLFRTDPTLTQGGADRSPPTGEFEFPTAGNTVAPRDSVFTRFRVQDNRGLT